LNEKLENIITRFYDDEIEYNKLKNDFKYIKFDTFFKRETGISLLEKYGFLKVLKKYNSKNEIWGINIINYNLLLLYLNYN